GRLHEVAGAVHARPDDGTLGVLRPHEEAGGRVVHAPAALHRASDGIDVQDVAVHDLDVETLERRRIGRRTDHRPDGLATLHQQAADVVAHVAVGTGYQSRTHADPPSRSFRPT